MYIFTTNPFVGTEIESVIVFLFLWTKIFILLGQKIKLLSQIRSVLFQSSHFI